MLSTLYTGSAYIMTFRLAPGGSMGYFVEGTTIKQIDMSTSAVSTLVSSGLSNWVHDLCFSPDGQIMVVADGATARKVDMSSGVMTTLASGFNNQGANECAFKHDGSEVLMTAQHQVWAITVSSGSKRVLAGGGQGYTDAVGSSAQFSWACGLKITPDGTKALVADKNNKKIRQIDLSTEAVTTIATTSDQNWGSLELSPDGVTLFGGIWMGGIRIKTIDLANNPATVQSLVTGTLSHVHSLSLSADRNTLYVANTYDNLVTAVD